MKGVRTLIKEQAELNYWRMRRRRGGLGNHHYVRYFTDEFGLRPDFFAGKRIVDIGCGPRGSLEWAHMASERVGVDPLADRYRKLGTQRHKMRYVTAEAESLPFGDCSFDVVSAFNSLDHVANVDRAIAEIKRVTSPGGTVLLIVEINARPSWTEPHELRPDVLELFPGWRVVHQRQVRMTGQIYPSLDASLPPGNGPAVMSARLERPLEGPQAASGHHASD